MNPRKNDEDQTKNSLTATTPCPPIFDMTNNFLHPAIKGCVAGVMAGTATHFVDYGLALRHNNKTEIKKAIIKNPFNGYAPGLLNAVSKGMAMFTIKPIFDSLLAEHNPHHAHLNMQISGSFAGIFAAYLTNPFSVLRIQGFLGKTTDDLKQLPLKDFLRGVHATAIRDGIHFGIYFNVLATISPYFENAGMPEAVSAAISGSIAGVTAALFANPFSVIANNQKGSEKPLSILQTGMTFFKAEGIKGLYPHFLSTTFLRMLLQGGGINLGIHLANYLLSEEKEQPQETEETEQRMTLGKRA